MDIKELGELLKAEREAQGLSLEEVFQKTKISISALKSLEAGETEDLPHPVYLKGFIKNYAQLLKLDADKLVTQFSKQCLLDLEAEACEDQVSGFRSRVRGWQVGGLLVLFVLFAAGAGWFFWLQGHQGDGLETVPVRQVPGDNRRQVGVENSSCLMHVEKQQLGEQQGNESQVSKQVLPAKNAEGGGPSLEEALPPSMAVDLPFNGTQRTVPLPDTNGQGASTADKQTGVPLAGPEYQVRVVAKENCWLRAISDENVKELFLKPGQEEVINFSSPLSLKLGNAGGVEIFFQGKLYDLNATSGQVMTLSFP